MNNAEDPVRAAVVRVIERIWNDTGRAVRPIVDADTFTGTLGLDSLDLAVLVVALEQELKVDPFRAGARAVQSVAELTQLYRTTIAAQAAR